jgi:hypothetical protein
MYIGKRNPHKKTRKNKKTQRHKKTIKGGKVLASGGFGCIFRPALKCQKEETGSANGVSKLMKKKYALKEYNEIVKYLPELEKIPNYQNYFLIDGFSICDPQALSSEDLQNFNKKCKALTKHGYTMKNVNKNLKKLNVLSMPYGGINVDKFIESINLEYTKMHSLNQSLKMLLKNGIIPMNQKGIYHCDIKDSNVLVQEEEEKEDALFTRLIDWGLSTKIDSATEKKVPRILLNRPFQFNVPFSNILFNDVFTKMYDDFLKDNPNPDYISIRSFVINYTVAWIDERGPGHLKTLNSIFREMFENTLTNIDAKFKEDIIEYEYTFYFIFEYLTQILFKFTRNNKFDSMDYFSTVFLKNIDVWGFVIIYVSIFEYLYDNYKKLNEVELDIIKTIKNMIFLLFKSSTEPIDIDSLEPMIDKLDELFLKASKQKTFVRSMKSASSASNSSKKSSSKSKTKSKSKSKTIRKTATTVTRKNTAKRVGGSVIKYYDDLKNGSSS